jgi:high potential iron-sulfur protein
VKFGAATLCRGADLTRPLRRALQIPYGCDPARQCAGFIAILGGRCRQNSASPQYKWRFSPMSTSRRTFLIKSLGAASALALTREAFADAPKVAESDPTAQALGYKEDATKVDKAKFAKYVAGEQCSNCSFYQGKPTDAYAVCPMFAGKQVNGKGWCSAYNKKA